MLAAPGAPRAISPPLRVVVAWGDAGSRGGPSGSGSRADAKGAGAGCLGAGKNGGDKAGGQGQECQAGYTDDWTAPNCRVWDPKTDSGRRTAEQNGKKDGA